MFARFRDILKSAYSYKEALERENLTQENVNLLREKLKSSKVVPQSLADKQVSRTRHTKNLQIFTKCLIYSS